MTQAATKQTPARQTTRKQPAKAAENPTTTAAAAAAESLAEGPIVLGKTKNKKKKKRKRRYSKGSRDFFELGRGLSKGTARLSKAVSSGVDAFYRQSDRSARKKKDGAARDLPQNLGRAVSVALKKASRVPSDVLEPVDANRAWKQTRKLLSPLRLS